MTFITIHIHTKQTNPNKWVKTDNTSKTMMRKTLKQNNKNRLSRFQMVSKW